MEIISASCYTDYIAAFSMTARCDNGVWRYDDTCDCDCHDKCTVSGCKSYCHDKCTVSGCKSYCRKHGSDYSSFLWDSCVCENFGLSKNCKEMK